MEETKETITQYRDPTNLNARSRLHARFSTNKYGWMRWVFDQFDLPPDGCILELGCGDGELWASNRTRVPPGWKITLSDSSLGMLDAAKRNLAAMQPQPAFLMIDAQTIALEANTFDAVIANHMFYHVPDLDAALAGITGVLRAAGTLYAATNGRSHMKELREILAPLAPDLPFVQQDTADAFGLENGGAILGRYFADVELRLYEDSLEITQAEPLLAWVMSVRGAEAMLDRAKIDRLRAVIRARIDDCGAMHLTKCAGMFVACADV